MNVEEITITNQICRACLDIGMDMYHLEEVYHSKDSNVKNLLELLEACASIQVSLNDHYPQYICKSCLAKANECYQFKIQCENAEKQLQKKEIVNTSTLIKEENELKIDNCTLPRLNLLSNLVQIPKKECNQQIKDVDIKQRTCDQCGKEFKYRANMIKHRHRHNKKSFPCIYCEEIFTNGNVLGQHKDQMHSHMKSLECPKCKKTFFKQSNLQTHMNIHLEIKKHICEVCGVSFAISGNLNAHRRLHIGLKPYKCKECDKAFTQQSALRSHEAGHSNKKDHVCSDCGAAFSRAGALRNHIIRHLPNRPFACTVCNKTFKFSSERKRHMIIHTGEKNHECDICGSRFNRSTNLAVHRRIHSGQKPYLCAMCNKSFNQLHCLKTHMAIHSITITDIKD